ncbi:unnamed protein product [Lampetra planeri]
MSKHLRKKNPPDPPSEEVVEMDDDDLLGATAPLPPTAALLDAAHRPREEEATTSRADEGWRLMAEQIESLRAMLLNLVTAVTSSTGLGRPPAVQLNAEDQDLRRETTSAIAPATRGEASILGGVAATEPFDAILREAATTWPSDAILSETRRTREAQVETLEASACQPLTSASTD